MWQIIITDAMGNNWIEAQFHTEEEAEDFVRGLRLLPGDEIKIVQAYYT